MLNLCVCVFAALSEEYKKQMSLFNFQFKYNFIII